MLRYRVMPCLLLDGTGLVKTTRFRNPRYLGDPRNAVRIFNEKEVDELILLDTGTSRRDGGIQYSLIEEIVSEAFMPVAYGGGLQELEQLRKVLAGGAEKVVLSSAALEHPALVTAAAKEFGSQSVVVCIDARRRFFGYEVVTHGAVRGTRLDPAAAAIRMVGAGAGEIVIQSTDRDGTMSGYDIDLTRRVTAAVDVPVVAAGGAGSVAHLAAAIHDGGAAAAAAGSMFVYQGKHRAVLISFPERDVLEAALGNDSTGAVAT
jgi:imidazole glycerol-phosphate synthase subunit HisF